MTYFHPSPVVFSNTSDCFTITDAPVKVDIAQVFPSLVVLVLSSFSLLQLSLPSSSVQTLSQVVLLSLPEILMNSLNWRSSDKKYSFSTLSIITSTISSAIVLTLSSRKLILLLTWYSKTVYLSTDWIHPPAYLLLLGLAYN